MNEPKIIDLEKKIKKLQDTIKTKSKLIFTERTSVDVANSYVVSKLPFNHFSQNGDESFFGNDTNNKGIVIKKNCIVRIEFIFSCQRSSGNATRHCYEIIKNDVNIAETVHQHNADTGIICGEVLVPWLQVNKGDVIFAGLMAGLEGKTSFEGNVDKPQTMLVISLIEELE